MSKKKKQNPPQKKSNTTLIYAAVAVLAVVVIAVLLLNFPSAPKEPVGKLPAAGEYVKLSLPSTYEPGKVKIIEFMKFDCPHCYNLHNSLPQILAKYGDNVTITYIPIAWPAQAGYSAQPTKSIEAYIIAEQMGKGSEMMDAMFNEAHAEMLNGKVIGTNLMVMADVATIERVAASIGLGSDFNSKLEGNYAVDAAKANLAEMSKYYVDGTPTIIINGNLQVNPWAATESDKDPPTNLDTVISSLLS